MLAQFRFRAGYPETTPRAQGFRRIMADDRTPWWGAYGLGLDPPILPASLVEVPSDWLRVCVERQVGRAPDRGNELDLERAWFGFADGGGLEVIAEERRAVLSTPQPMSNAEVVHPYLAPVAATFAWWAGHEAFHAGAVLIDGRVWAVVGEKGEGKSTLLGFLALAGHTVMCDDLLVVADGMAMAGPRCVDLRETAAKHLGAGELTLRAPEKRWRLALGPVAASAPLGGWIFLGLGAAVSASRLDGRTLLTRLAENRSMFVVPRDPEVLLDLATLPAWVLRRPREWAALAPTADHLVELARRA
jgi:hypothetical protein